MDRGAWQASYRFGGCKESDTLKKHFLNTLKVHFTDRFVKILGPTMVNHRVISAHLEGQ